MKDARNVNHIASKMLKSHTHSVCECWVKRVLFQVSVGNTNGCILVLCFFTWQQAFPQEKNKNSRASVRKVQMKTWVRDDDVQDRTCQVLNKGQRSAVNGLREAVELIHGPPGPLIAAQRRLVCMPIQNCSAHCLFDAGQFEIGVR